MKEVSILVNGNYIIKKNNNNKIFLHADETGFMIHLVEGINNNFRKRIEIKKKDNDNNKYIFFCYYLNPCVVYSGHVTITEDNLVVGDISFQILESGKTNIVEGYYLTLSTTGYSLEHIVTRSIDRRLLYTNRSHAITISNIDTFLFDIINQINNRRSIKNEMVIPFSITFSHVLNEERHILEYIESLLETYPELGNFLANYHNKFNRKRIPE